MTQELNCESNIIGGLLLYPHEASGLISGLDPSDFVDENYAEIFSLAKGVFESNPSADRAVILAKLNKNEELKRAAMFCGESFVSMATYTEYVRVVREESQGRRIRNKLQEIIMDGSGDYLEDLTRIIDSEKDVCNDSRYKDLTYRQILEYLKELEFPEDKCRRIYTGFSRLDKALGGLKRKTLSIIGARPSTGKTTFALNIIQRQKKYTTVLFSLEMSAPQIYDRLISDKCGISYQDINMMTLSLNDKEKMTECMFEYRDENRLTIIDDIYSVEAMSGVIHTLRPELVVIDFLQCMRTNQKIYDRRGQMDYISSELKRLAKYYDCHILALSQITRAGKDAPTMSDLKESGGLEQDGDYIMLLHRPFVIDKKAHENDPSDTELMLDKNKYGQTGLIDMHFDGEHQRFSERDKSHEDNELPAGWGSTNE